MLAVQVASSKCLHTNFSKVVAGVYALKKEKTLCMNELNASFEAVCSCMLRRFFSPPRPTSRIQQETFRLIVIARVLFLHFHFLVCAGEYKVATVACEALGDPR